MSQRKKEVKRHLFRSPSILWSMALSRSRERPPKEKGSQLDGCLQTSRYKQAQPCQFGFGDHRMFRNRVAYDATSRPTKADRNEAKRVWRGLMY